MGDPSWHGANGGEEVGNMFQKTPSFLSDLLKPKWKNVTPYRVQYRGGWVEVPHRFTDPGLLTAAKTEWPMKRSWVMKLIYWRWLDTRPTVRRS
jgi:hypothetical protein